jgi:hypothetical protein
MEKWNIEYSGSKADDGLILFSGQCQLIKIDLIPPNPVFQQSIIPIPHCIHLRQSLLSVI